MSADRPWEGRALHFVGIGGAGMSGYARVASQLGARVSGSDRAETPFVASLREDGTLAAGSLHIGHAEANLPPDEDLEVVYSSAVAEGNEERVAARRRGLRERPRAELLAELSALRRTIAVAGTHGKTTTASMIVCALRGAGMDPGWLIGASPASDLPNAEWGTGEWLVVEADESDRSLLRLEVEIALLTNVELDHADAFGSLAELRELFARFLAAAPTAVVWDRPELLALRSGDVVAYDAADVVLSTGGSRFRWRGREVRLGVPGAHNALDAAGALEAARLAGAEEASAIGALAGFSGARRRMERLGRSGRGASVIDDYAHHPTEVAATIVAARTLLEAPGRLFAVFQPHLFSRTRAFARQFGTALAHADVVAVLDVYPARERPEEHPGISGLTVAEAVADAAPGAPVYWLPTFASARTLLERELAEGDVCLVMGAGDVDELARALVSDRDEAARAARDLAATAAAAGKPRAPERGDGR